MKDRLGSIPASRLFHAAGAGVSQNPTVFQIRQTFVFLNATDPSFSLGGHRVARCETDQYGPLDSTNFIADGHGVAYTPDFRFMTDGDPHAAFAIVKELDQLPMNDFIAANRRNSLADDIARLQAAKAQ